MIFDTIYDLIFFFLNYFDLLFLILIFIMCAYFYQKHTHYVEKVPVAIIEKYKDL